MKFNIEIEKLEIISENQKGQALFFFFGRRRFFPHRPPDLDLCFVLFALLWDFFFPHLPAPQASLMYLLLLQIDMHFHFLAASFEIDGMGFPHLFFRKSRRKLKKAFLITGPGRAHFFDFLLDFPHFRALCLLWALFFAHVFLRFGFPHVMLLRILYFFHKWLPEICLIFELIKFEWRTFQCLLFLILWCSLFSQVFVIWVRSQVVSWR